MATILPEAGLVGSVWGSLSGKQIYLSVPQGFQCGRMARLPHNSRGNRFMITALCIIYVVGMCFFSIAFLVDWLGSFEAIRKYLKYGIWVGLILAGPKLLVVVMTPSSWQPMLLMDLLGELIIFLKQMGFTMLGM